MNIFVHNIKHFFFDPIWKRQEHNYWCLSHLCYQVRWYCRVLGEKFWRTKQCSSRASVITSNQQHQVHTSLVSPSQIEEESTQIQPAPCFGRSTAGWQVSSKVLITVGNQYSLANLRCSSSDLFQSNYSRSFSNADWTSRPSTRFCLQKPARTHPIILSKLLFTSARSSLDFSPIVV